MISEGFQTELKLLPESLILNITQVKGINTYFPVSFDVLIYFFLSVGCMPSVNTPPYMPLSH